MRFAPVLAAIAIGFVSTVACQAAPAGQSCVALTAGGAPRLAATVASPADCCTGRMQCAQFLSTTVVVRPQRDQRT